MAKSLNPRQMQLSSELNAQCAFDLPGLNKIKWWTKDGNRIVNALQSPANDLNALGSINSTNGLISGNTIQPSQFELNAINQKEISYIETDLCFTCAK